MEFIMINLAIVIVYLMAGMVMVIGYNMNFWYPKISESRNIRVVTRLLMLIGWPIFTIISGCVFFTDLINKAWSELTK